MATTFRKRALRKVGLFIVLYLPFCLLVGCLEEKPAKQPRAGKAGVTPAAAYSSPKTVHVARRQLTSDHEPAPRVESGRPLLDINLAPRKPAKTAAAAVHQALSGGKSQPESSRKAPAQDPPEVPGEAPSVAPLLGAPTGGGVRVAAAPHARGDKFDPVAVNGRLFQGWPIPKLAIVFSGDQHGFLEPCGCAGLTNMKGGLMRRHTLIKQLREEFKWPAVAAFDVGGLVRRFGWQAERKYDAAVKALKLMPYDAVGFGAADLRLGLDPLLSAAVGEELPFVAANVALFDFEQTPTQPYRVIRRGGHKIGVTAVVGKSQRRGIHDDGLKFKTCEAAIQEALPKLKRAGCDLLILLSHSSREESRALAKKFPDFHYVVTARGADEPPAVPEVVPGTKTRLVEVGRKGMYVNVVALFDDKNVPRRFQRVPVDSRFPDSPQVKRLLSALQDEYRARYMQSGWKGLGLTYPIHPSGRKYVGSAVCADCHTKAHAVWEKTPHSHATDTLVKLDPPRQFDPECVSCHSTGWSPQKYFPFASGFESIKKSPLLVGNGCENCHGPGSRHVAIENGDVDVTAAERKKAQQEMRVTIAVAKDNMCAKCHDLDNSPDYVKKGFEAYWPRVEHKGKD